MADKRVLCGDGFLMAENHSSLIVPVEVVDSTHLIAKFHALEKVQFSADTSQWEPVFIPYASSLVSAPFKWGLTIEHENGKFLDCGQYNISTSYRDENYEIQVDFVTMSRCILTEGTELWLKLNSSLYVDILQQVKENYTASMLPISKSLHTQMQQGDIEGEVACARFLRCFYVLGGSKNTGGFHNNSIHVFIALAHKNSPIGHKSTQDDDARINSLVNQHIDTQQYSLLNIVLDFSVHDPQTCLHYNRDAALPFYKYLKTDYVSRGR